MNKAGFLFIGAMISGASLLYGCGGDSAGTGGAGGAGDGGAAASTSTTASGPSSSVSTSATSSSGGATVAATCDSYCTDIDTNCKAANQQWPSKAVCVSACTAAKFAQGKADMGATKEDSLECRAYHAGAPSKAMPEVHCFHAGPLGGDGNPAEAAGAQCGEGCEAFCKIATGVCAGKAGSFKDEAECKTACAKFAPVTTYSTEDKNKNDFGCRMYHLSVAATDAASADTHCAHIVATSTTCTM